MMEIKPVAVLDACVLYPTPLRDLLIRLGIGYQRYCLSS